jgi:transposase
VRTSAPKGQTPVLQYHFNWHQLSVIAGITVTRFYFRLFASSIKGPQIIEFLHAFGQQIRQPLLVIWDGLAVYRSELVREYLDALGGAVQVEQLPAYALELNPTGHIRGYLKQHELDNYCTPDLGSLQHRARLRSMQLRLALVRAFRAQAELQFRPRRQITQVSIGRAGTRIAADDDDDDDDDDDVDEVIGQGNPERRMAACRQPIVPLDPARVIDDLTARIADGFLSGDRIGQDVSIEWGNF